MSYTKTGYIKSIYGIIADSIKEEIMILLKSDYFAYRGWLHLKNMTHALGDGKTETESSDELLNLSVGKQVLLHCFFFFFCSELNNSIRF